MKNNVDSVALRNSHEDSRNVIFNLLRGLPKERIEVCLFGLSTVPDEHNFKQFILCLEGYYEWLLHDECSLTRMEDGNE